MIKNIVFDLDGTLWQTRKSYIYAYKKLCEKYNKTPINGYEDVLNYMGVKVDLLLKDLFPDIIDQSQIIRDALNFSIEYIINNPDGTCFSGAYEVLKNLSNQYDLYIISNCLKEYVETFLNISNTKEYIKDFYTIELGEKSEHLKKISNGFTDKTIFIGDDVEDYNHIEDHTCIYFVFAKYGYKKCDVYDYHINSLNDLSDVLKVINKKERILEKDKYEVISCNDTNLTLINKKDHKYYFGFLNIYNYSDLQVVIDKLKNKTKGSTIIGPIDGNTYYKYRFSTDNFDWHLYPDTYNDKVAYEMFINNGFIIKQNYSSTLANINDRLYTRSKKIKVSDDYRFVLIEGDKCYDYVEQLYNVAINAFSKADFYEEISKADFIELYLDNIRLCTPDLLLVYYKDELVAFHFTYEDIEKRFYVSKTVGIKKDHQFHKCLFKMIDYFYSLVIEKGYDKVLHHFMNDRTNTLQLMYLGYELNKKHFVLLEYKNEK